MTSTTLSQHDFEQYEIIHLLGKGAMGSVFLARDRRIGRRVALKVIHLAPNAFEDQTSANEFYRRLQREAEVCGALLHPNIVTLYDVGYENDRVSYLAMEYVEGETLAELLRRSGSTLPVDTVTRIAQDVLHGLEYAHSKGIIHRDIKPANILISSDGTAKIADFGIARPLESSMTRAGSFMGTPNYMSPEQVESRELTPKADIFSLGVVLHELLTGTKPYAANDLAGIMNNVLNQPVPRIRGSIGELIARMVAKSPDHRPSASEALSQLHPRSAFGVRRLAAALVIIAAIVMAMFAANRSPEAKPQLQDVNAKRRALAEAQSLYDQKKYAESAQKYEAYLKKYPYSTVAQEGRDRARQALAPRAATPKQRPKTKRDEDISPRELLHRLKKAIRGK